MNVKPDVITTSLLITAGSTVVAKAVSNKTGERALNQLVRPFAGIFVIGLALYGFNEVSPELANSFAILVMVSALLLNGDKIATAVHGATGK